MAPRFRLFLLMFWMGCFAAGSLGAQSSPETQQNSEALEMIAKRMKSLTQSLNGMPQPPVMTETIQIPNAPFVTKPKETSKKSQE